jgi:hypothetical protein
MYVETDVNADQEPELIRLFRILGGLGVVATSFVITLAILELQGRFWLTPC